MPFESSGEGHGVPGDPIRDNAASDARSWQADVAAARRPRSAQGAGGSGEVTGLSFRLTTTSALAAADALILPLFEDGLAQIRGLPSGAQGAYERAADDDAVRLLYHVATQTLERGPIGRVVVVNGGKRADFGIERARRVASAGVRALWDLKVRGIAVAFDSGLDDRTAVRAAIEGVHYAMFRPESLRTQERLRHLPPIATVQVVVTDPKAVASEVARADVVGRAVNLVRRLSNTPANQMTPRVLADEAVALAKEAKLKAEVLDEKEAAQLGMHSFLSVSQGSHEPPRFIVLRHEGRGGTGYDVAVVGKGITFDSGGISLKDPEGMHLMKGDMTGGAVAIATLWALANTGAKVNALAIVPATENLPGGGATKPGDVVTSMGGKTIEIINTDAEGRLVLVDGVTYALRQGAQRVVTVATLTGAIVVALGNHLTGVFGKPDDFVGEVIAASKRAGEKMWPMPIAPEHRQQIQSDIADIKNTGGRPGGACTAAAFIEAHVEEGRPWAHLDIAGTFWAENDASHSPKGPQGPAVRTLVELAEMLAG